MSQKGFYFDQTRCIGCDACLVACKDWNSVNAGPAFWRRRTETEVGGYPDLKVYQLTMGCNHCASPACVKVCPMGAIYKREEDGVVIVDRTACIACKMCLAACPFSAPQYANDTQEPDKSDSWKVDHPMQKCTACWDRVAAGKQTACVGACPQRAIDFGVLDDLKSKYSNTVSTATGYPTQAVNSASSALGKDLDPSIIFKRK